MAAIGDPYGAEWLDVARNGPVREILREIAGVCGPIAANQRFPACVGLGWLAFYPLLCRGEAPHHFGERLTALVTPDW